MIHDRRIALVFRGGSLILIFAGIASTLKIFTGGIKLSGLMYYTVQSNILALLLFAMLTVKTVTGLKKNGKTGSAGYFPRFEMICVIDLLLTFFVYWFMLAPSAFSMGTAFNLWTFDNLTVHMFAPLLCLIDYILFTDSGHLKYRDVYFVVIYPLFYVLFSTIAGFSGYVYRYTQKDIPVRFPYFFIDYDQVGLKSLLYIAVLAVIFLVFSHSLYLLDKKVKKPVLIPRKSK